MRKNYLIALILSATVIAGMSIAGCTPQNNVQTDKADASGGQSSELVVELEWSPESDCAICHAEEEGLLSDKTTTAGYHEAEDVGCTDCHGDTAGMDKAHKGVTTADPPSTRLRETTISAEACTASACHGDETALVLATAAFTGLEDSTGKIINPHSLPVGSGHAGMNCSTCHTGHEAFDSSDVVGICFSCHHERVFECGTCHDA